MASPLVLPRDEIQDILPEIALTNDKHLGRKRANPIILIGPPGTGKTSMAAKLAEQIDRMFFKTASHPDYEASEMFGRFLPLKGEWDFVYGPALRAWGYPDREGDVLCVDDIHLMGPGGQSSLYTALDAGVGGSYLHPDGTMLYPKEQHVVVCTMNGEIDSLDPAVRDRARIIIPVMEPSTPMLEALHEDIRVLCEADYDNNFDPVATYREWRSMSDLWPIVGLARASLMALGTQERAQKMLKAMSTVGIKDAKDAHKEILMAAPSGVR